MSLWEISLRTARSPKRNVCNVSSVSGGMAKVSSQRAKGHLGGEKRGMDGRNHEIPWNPSGYPLEHVLTMAFKCGLTQENSWFFLLVFRMVHPICTRPGKRLQKNLWKDNQHFLAG